MCRYLPLIFSPHCTGWSQASPLKTMAVGDQHFDTSWCRLATGRSMHASDLKTYLDKIPNVKIKEDCDCRLPFGDNVASYARKQKHFSAPRKNESTLRGLGNREVMDNKSHTPMYLAYYFKVSVDSLPDADKAAVVYGVIIDATLHTCLCGTHAWKKSSADVLFPL